MCKVQNFDPNNCITFQQEDLYYVGVLLAVTSCIAGGLMDVMVAKCEDVSASVLVNWSAICGLAMSVIYCLAVDNSYILSPRIMTTTWTMWATYFGKD